MATKIMIIRHGEKPTDNDDVKGVAEDGRHDPDELSVRGWQRAGALVRFFSPRNGHFSQAELATPELIFAADPASGKSRRSAHTVRPLADFLGKKVDVTFAKGDEPTLAHHLENINGIVLIAWEHKLIPEIVNNLVGNDKLCPQKWPDSRFDLVWILERETHSAGWKFSQAPQLVLCGDSPSTV